MTAKQDTLVLLFCTTECSIGKSNSIISLYYFIIGKSVSLVYTTLDYKVWSSV